MRISSLQRLPMHVTLPLLTKIRGLHYESTHSVWVNPSHPSNRQELSRLPFSAPDEVPTPKYAHCRCTDIITCEFVRLTQCVNLDLRTCVDRRPIDVQVVCGRNEPVERPLLPAGLSIKRFFVFDRFLALDTSHTHTFSDRSFTDTTCLPP